MTKDEALRMALDELCRVYHDDEAGPYTLEVIKAIKQALEQPEPEPVVCRHRIVDITNEVIKSGYMCMDCGAFFGAYTTSPPKREPLTEGETHCKDKRENGGVCPHHNLQCGWPECNEAAHGIGEKK